MAVMFPSTGMQVLSCLIFLLGLSILSHCISRRVQCVDFSSWTSISQTSWARWCILLIFLDSWLFLFASGITVFGVGLETDPQTCGAAIYICVAFYTTSKLLIYSFLTEKAHVVWAPSVGSTRFRSPIYILCIVMITVYASVITLMVVGRVHFWRDDGVCMIGLRAYATIPLLTYDALTVVFLNGLFLWPLLRCRKLSQSLKRVALRTLVASIAALTTSLVNITVLTTQNGHQLGWVCLGSCGSDVVLNAMAIFWVTKRSTASQAWSDTSITEITTHRELPQQTSKVGGIVFAPMNVTRLTTNLFSHDWASSAPPQTRASSGHDVDWHPPTVPSPIPIRERGASDIPLTSPSVLESGRLSHRYSMASPPPEVEIRPNNA